MISVYVHGLMDGSTKYFFFEGCSVRLFACFSNWWQENPVSSSLSPSFYFVFVTLYFYYFKCVYHCQVGDYDDQLRACATKQENMKEQEDTETFEHK